MMTAAEAAALHARQAAHTGCNCVQDFQVTGLNVLDDLINVEQLEQDDAARLLWDFGTPIANDLAVKHAGAQARAHVRAELSAAFPWLAAIA